FNGTINLVRQSINAGIKKIITTATFGILFDSQFNRAYGTELVTEDFWNPVTLETFNFYGRPYITYLESYVLADKKIWEFAKEHPDVDFTNRTW
ncbi:hypothetical protein GYMLUDRAFT_181867, partial [Collybiopsis luxurians FD-317 M1]